MVGFYGGSPLRYPSIEEMGVEAVPSSTGEILGGAASEGFRRAFPTLDVTRIITRTPGVRPPLSPAWGPNPDSGIADDLAAREAEDPTVLPLAPEEANARYGIKGMLNFDRPIAEEVARDLYEQKRAQIRREDALARSEGGLLVGGAARLAAGVVGSLPGVLDPLNLATAFVPVVGPSRYAAMLYGAGSAAGRAGIRAGVGAAEGAVGMALLQPLEYGIARADQEDFTMADALRNIAFGGVLGGGLHVTGGAVLDRTTGRYSNPLTQQIEDIGPEARETLLKGALAQAIEGRPVDVEPALRAVTPPPAPTMRRPPDIIDFLMDRGGVLDEGGELRAMDLHRPMRGKFGTLSRRNGIHLDHAREIAVEAGYLPPDATIRDMFDAIGDTARGRPVFRPDEAAEWFDAEQARFARERGDLDDPFHPENLFADLDDLAATARREPPDELMARIDADEVMARPSDELQALQKQIADLERQASPPRSEPDAAPETASNRQELPSVADRAAEAAEARASAVERAAACLTRFG